MENQIRNLEIQNFKSIKHLQLDCKRVNIFIGEPNVGKSNILEALSLLGACAVPESFKDFVRFEHVSNLFYDNNLDSTVLVKVKVWANQYKSELKYHHAQIFTLSIFDENNQKRKDGELYLKDNQVFEPDANFYKQTYSYFFTKKYDFKKLTSFPSESPNFLRPPYGENLFEILRKNADLKQEIKHLLQKQNLKLSFRAEEKKLEVLKEVDETFYFYPYSNIADTLQRVIFYLTAIGSNRNSVLLFEEPEAHSFPPYVGMLADRITADESNQYFITTHSPYLFENLLGKMDWNELNVNIVYFEDYQTKIKTLGKEALQDTLDNYIDIFFNLNRYLDYE